MTNTVKKPHAESCDENSAVILAVLQERLPERALVLEIGSGTGQHAVHFGAALPGIRWQTSERLEHHAGIQLWLEEAGLDNALAPIELDVSESDWPAECYDAVFTANTAHIMPQASVVDMFRGVAGVLNDQGIFLIYGPFMYNGEHTSESNIRFDAWLKSVEPHRGVRDLAWLQEIAGELGLYLHEDIAMPANNRILMWKLRT